MKLDEAVADVLRRLAKYEHRLLSEVLSDALVAYCQRRHPQFEMIFESDDMDDCRDDLQGAAPKATPERREEERRKKERALPTTAERREPSNRRKG